MRSDVYREHWNKRFKRYEPLAGRSKLESGDQIPDQPTFYAGRVGDRPPGERPSDRHVAAIFTLLLVAIITAFVAAFAYIPDG